MPVTNDVSYSDIQARTALRGGVLYRDMVEPNLPGVVWIHMLVRSVAGWSTEALRIFDLVIFSLIAVVFGIGNSRGSESRTVGCWTALALVLAYFSVSEWCHVQRDVWLLLPVAVSILLRQRQLERFARRPVSLKVVSTGASSKGYVSGQASGSSRTLSFPPAASGSPVFCVSLFILFWPISWDCWWAGFWRAWQELHGWSELEHGPGFST